MQVKFLSTFLSLILVLHVLNFSYSIKLPFKATIPQFETTSFSFSAIYEFNDSPFDMDVADPNVTLFNPEYLGDYVIKKMVVNGKEIKKPTNYYYFEKEGEYYYISFLLDISKSTSLKRMFSNIDELIEINITEAFETSNIETIEEMFYNNENLRSVNFGNINTKNVKSMKRMFALNRGLTSIKFGKFDTSKVETMHAMFEHCLKLEKIDISNFELSNNKDMSFMFDDCKCKICLIFLVIAYH